MNKELIKEFEEKFEIMKKELGFASTLEEIDEIFFLKDKIFDEGFVSQKINRQVCSRIVETYMSWVHYLHSLVVPNPQNILNLSEARVFGPEEKKKINNLMKQAMEIGSRNTWIGLTKNKIEESKFIDDAIRKWKEEFNPELMKIIEKVKGEWEK